MGHPAFEGRLLVCDMDGTLLDSGSRLSSVNRAALERFVAGGGLFTVATGRMEKTVLGYLEGMPVNVPAILYNGAAIYDFKKGMFLWCNYMDPGTVEHVRRIIKLFPGIGAQVCRSGEAYFASENEYTHAHMVRENFTPLIVADAGDVPQPWLKVLLAWDPRRLTEVEEYLDSVEAPFRHVYSEPQFLELLNRGVSKGSALEALTALLGIDASKVVAVGDNLNDVELIKAAGVGIAVANAHEGLKAVAGLCCPHHDMNAVSAVIRWMETGRMQ